VLALCWWLVVLEASYPPRINNNRCLIPLAAPSPQTLDQLRKTGDDVQVASPSDADSLVSVPSPVGSFHDCIAEPSSLIALTWCNTNEGTLMAGLDRGASASGGREGWVGGLVGWDWLGGGGEGGGWRSENGESAVLHILVYLGWVAH
jgi:hypothetical protein